MPKLICHTMFFIKNPLTEPIYLSELSKNLCLSSDYISHEFKKYTGLTLRSYILNERITLAKTLLAEGKNVTEACYMSGFSDYSNFIRSFTKIIGISPGRYRNNLFNINVN